MVITRTNIDTVGVPFTQMYLFFSDIKKQTNAARRTLVSRPQKNKQGKHRAVFPRSRFSFFVSPYPCTARARSTTHPLTVPLFEAETYTKRHTLTQRSPQRRVR